MKMTVWFVFVLAANSAADKVVVSSVGKTFTLDCGVPAFSESLEWRHGNNLICRVNGKTGSTLKGRSSIVGRAKVKHQTKLEINGVTEEDCGEFTCTADTRIYKQTLLLVSVSVGPSNVVQLGGKALLRCGVKGPKLDPVVQWKGPSGQSPAGSQEVQLSPVKASDEGVWQCVFSHGGQTFSQNVSIGVKVPPPQTTPSVLKPSKDTPASGVTVHPSADDVYLLGLSWWAWLALGGGCLFLTLLMVCVIILCKKIRRRKRRFLRMKNPQQPLKPKKFCQCHHPTAAAKPQQGRRREPPSALRL